MKAESILAEAARRRGLHLKPTQLAQFSQLSELLLDWNQRLNLTSITDPADIAIRHYLDSLTLVKVIRHFDGRQLIDVGTGAGFPGLALAIVFPGLRVTLLDATAKKLRFIDCAARALTLENIRTLHARAEAAGQHPDHRGAYDMVTARAVAKMPILMEYTLPLAKLGGQIIAMQGSSAHQDVKGAANAIAKLGGKPAAIEKISLPGLDKPRYLVVIDKLKPTPAHYPRKAGTPVRQPIQ